MTRFYCESSPIIGHVMRFFYNSSAPHTDNFLLIISQCLCWFVALEMKAADTLLVARENSIVKSIGTSVRSIT